MIADFAQRQSSPNRDDRIAGTVDMIVLHYTGMESGQAALDRLCDPLARVSAHYLVEEDGRLFNMVPEDKRAWHAGVSHWDGQDGVNECSIGIEIVNPGHWWGYTEFPDPQIETVMRLLKDIRTRWNIPKERIVGHSDVAPARKEDPGELFPWPRLAKAGLAIDQVTKFVPDQLEDLDYEACLQALRDIGYGVGGTDHGAVVLAFQRRFCPLALGQGLDPLTRQALKVVRAQLG